MLKNIVEKVTIQDIIELYTLGIISLEDIVKINDSINISESISFKTLDSYYRQLKNKPEDEQAINEYEKYLNLYKEINIKEKIKNE